MDIEIDNHYLWFNAWLRCHDKSYNTGDRNWFVRARIKAALPPNPGYNDMTEIGFKTPPYTPTARDIKELEKIGCEFENDDNYKKLIFTDLGT